MKLEYAQRISNLVEDIGEEASVNEEYSGRGMMGKLTAGVVVEHESHILNAIGDFLENTDEHDIKEINKLGEALNQKLRTDNMGKGIILY